MAIQWGERLGAGVIIDGRLHRGAGAAGEIGFIHRAGKPQEAGGRGQLEASIGAEAIRARAREVFGQRSGRTRSAARDALDLFRAAADGDKPALAFVEQLVKELCEALAPALLVLCPDAVIVSGGVARAGNVLLEAMQRNLDELTLVPPRVELSALAEGATLHGAYRLGLDAVWERALGA